MDTILKNPCALWKEIPCVAGTSVKGVVGSACESQLIYSG